MTGSSISRLILVMLSDIWQDLQDQECKGGLFEVLQDKGAYLVELKGCELRVMTG